MYCKSVNEEDVQVHGAKDELQARNDLTRTRRDETAQTGTGTGPGQDKNQQDKDCTKTEHGPDIDETEIGRGATSITRTSTDTT